IRVGRQDQLVGAFEGLGDIIEALLRFRIDFPDHPEIVVRIHRPVFRGQVAHVAERGQNLVTTTQVLIDCLGLSRRFDNDDVHDGPWLWVRGIPGTDLRAAPGKWVSEPLKSNRVLMGGWVNRYKILFLFYSPRYKQLPHGVNLFRTQSS